VVVAVLSGRAGGSYGPLSAADNVTPITTAARKHAGASTITRGRRNNGRIHSSKKYHNNPANTTITATDSHHGNPSINGLLSSYTLPPSYPTLRIARNDSEARGLGPVVPLGPRLRKFLDAGLREPELEQLDEQLATNMHHGGAERPAGVTSEARGPLRLAAYGKGRLRCGSDASPVHCRWSSGGGATDAARAASCTELGQELQVTPKLAYR
jgi:hypothetical protein